MYFETSSEKQITISKLLRLYEYSNLVEYRHSNYKTRKKKKNTKKRKK